MIRRVEHYHGVALARLIRADGSPAITIRRHPAYRSAYIIDERVALYIKYSTNRLSPWPFGFNVPQQSEIADLRDEFDEVFVALVCGLDGIACLNGAEYQRVLDDDPQAGEWIKAARSPREKYRITGSDERTVYRIGNNEYPAKVYATGDVRGVPPEASR